MITVSFRTDAKITIQGLTLERLIVQLSKSGQYCEDIKPLIQISL